MRIRTNATPRDLYDAAAKARVSFTRFNHGNTRDHHDNGFDVILEGSSNRNQNNNSGDKAATWDEWGIFLNHIFDIDYSTNATHYKGGDDFHYKTDWRFENLKWEDQHNHKWYFNGVPYHNSCKCGAVRRWK